MGTRRGFLLTMGAAMAARTELVQAQQAAEPFPNRAVRVIVPYPAGVLLDVIPRWVTQRVSEQWGQPIVVENRPGANGIIGATQVQKSPPDGYTLLVGVHATMAVNPHAYRNLPYDPFRDFMPVACLSAGTYLIVANNNVPVNSLAELVAYAKQQQAGRLDYATYGVASGSHLTGEMLNMAAGIRLNAIHYKASPISDVVSGAIPLSIEPANVAGPFVNTGRLKAIAATSLKRLPAFPSVPTVAETFPNFESMPWFGFFAPAGTPAPIVDKLATDILAVTRSPEMASFQLGLGSMPLPLGPQAFAELIRKDYEAARKVIEANNIRLE